MNPTANMMGGGMPGMMGGEMGMPGGQFGGMGGMPPFGGMPMGPSGMGGQNPYGGMGMGPMGMPPMPGGMDPSSMNPMSGGFPPSLGMGMNPTMGGMPLQGGMPMSYGMPSGNIGGAMPMNTGYPSQGKPMEKGNVQPITSQPYMMGQQPPSYQYGAQGKPSTQHLGGAGTYGLQGYQLPPPSYQQPYSQGMNQMYPPQQTGAPNMQPIVLKPDPNCPQCRGKGIVDQTNQICSECLKKCKQN